MLRRFVLHFVLFASLMASALAFAAKAPLGPEELDKQSDAIVVGKVQSFRTESRAWRAKSAPG